MKLCYFDVPGIEIADKPVRWEGIHMFERVWLNIGMDWMISGQKRLGRNEDGTDAFVFLPDKTILQEYVWYTTDDQLVWREV